MRHLLKSGFPTLLIALNCQAQGVKPPSLFQGLQWGAPESQVVAKARTLGSYRKGECDGFIALAKAKLKLACDHPMVQPYEVAGVPFQLSLNLEAATRKFASASLWYSAELAPTAGDPTSPESLWRNRQAQIYSSLVERYGQSISRNVKTTGYITVVISKWKTDDMVIEMEAVLTERPQGPVGEQYQVTYEPVTSRDSSRL